MRRRRRQPSEPPHDTDNPEGDITHGAARPRLSLAVAGGRTVAVPDAFDDGRLVPEDVLGLVRYVRWATRNRMLSR